MASSARGTGLGSAITGLIVAAAAVVPLVWYTSTGSEPSAPEAVTTTAVVSTVTEVTVPETIEVTPDPVEVAELPESVVRALEDAGNVREEGAGELELPASVINVLADHDVVLRVAEAESP
jgi:hypothetical protein